MASDTPNNTVSVMHFILEWNFSWISVTFQNNVNV